MRAATSFVRSAGRVRQATRQLSALQCCKPALAHQQSLPQRRLIGSTPAPQAESLLSRSMRKMAVAEDAQGPDQDVPLVIVAFGPDKPGIVARLGGVIKEANGYVEIGKMTKLANFFCVMFEALVPTSAVDATMQSLKNMPDFDVMVKRAHHRPQKDGVKSEIINIRGSHRRGIVGSLSEVLAKLDININDMNFYTEIAPFSETPIFRLNAVVTLPPRVSYKMLEREMMTVADELEVDIWFEKNH
eukprot:CAMPEP_0177653364 /NCGR_PEP_ID=MMETSP0447-20121125/13696_1 /TAXON_ID=0 /ORGANISM="Stygamoeba regulata, Strain BSH-02190019" /LENGTH=244 /DNA_ID=CAMNT_0019156815 /DNA_START=66 /DNA_END=800 /DNA_ORIENTATION=-